MSKILIVDDDAHIRELIRVFLRNDGFEVIEAVDGVDALSKLDSLKADLAIIDVMMPSSFISRHGKHAQMITKPA